MSAQASSRCWLDLVVANDLQNELKTLIGAQVTRAKHATGPNWTRKKREPLCGTKSEINYKLLINFICMGSGAFVNLHTHKQLKS